MFDRFFDQARTDRRAAPDPAPSPDPAGDTATVRRIVARLEAMPPEQARLIASAAYTLARAAHADLEISDEETAAIERELQRDGALDEATAVLVTEMAKLQAKTVGGTEDYVVTREFKALATPEQRLDVLRACFAIGAASGTISAEETAVSTRSPASSTSTRRRSTRSGPSSTSGSRRSSRSGGSAATPDGRPSSGAGEVDLDEPVTEPPADLGQQLGVVGDAAPELHRQGRAATRPGTWITTRVSPGRSRSTRLERLHRDDDPIARRDRGEPDVQDRERSGVDRARRRSRRRRSAPGPRRARTARRRSSGAWRHPAVSTWVETGSAGAIGGRSRPGPVPAATPRARRTGRPGAAPDRRPSPRPDPGQRRRPARPVRRRPSGRAGSAATAPAAGRSRAARTTRSSSRPPARRRPPRSAAATWRANASGAGGRRVVPVDDQVGEQRDVLALVVDAPGDEQDRARRARSGRSVS